MTKVPIESIELELSNCRKKLRNIDELAADIKQNGLQQPLVVWVRRPHRGTTRYFLESGHRRLAAIKLIRESDPGAFAQVPVSLKKGNEDDALFRQLSENIQREDLTPAELANALYMMRERGYSQAELVKRLSKSAGWVNRLLAIRDRCSAKVFRALESDKITLEQAHGYSKLEEPKQDAQLGKFLDRAKTVGARAARSETKPKRPSASKIRKCIERLDIERRMDAERGDDPSADRIPANEVTDLVIAALKWTLGEGEEP